MNTKKIIIEDVKYGLELTKNGKIKNVVFSFKFDNGSVHKATAFYVNTTAFRFDIPYCGIQQGLTNFNKVKYSVQIEALDGIVDKLIDFEIEVGYFENVYYDINIMRRIMNVYTDNYLLPSFCNTSNGTIKIFEYDENHKRILHPPFDRIILESKNRKISV